MTKIASILILTVCLVYGKLLAVSESDPQAPSVKNIIIMISDGCGFNQVEAAGLYRSGTTGSLIFESFPFKCAMSTYSADKGYVCDEIWSAFGTVTHNATDSSAAATAMATGVKSYDGAIGVDSDGRAVENVLESAEKKGKATGVVTSVQFSHATPAGFVAHKGSRNDYTGIAQEMITKSATDVIMGCGHPLYDNDGKPLEAVKEADYIYVGGETIWKSVETGVKFADADGDGKGDAWTLIQTRDDFKKLMNGDAPKRVLGVAQVAATLQQGRSGGNADPFKVPFTENVPMLNEMTAAALNVLDADPDGFVLMIEGGAIDWACHAHQSGRMIEEELGFADAVQTVCEWVEKNSSWDETLLIVTGDHETGYLTGPGSGGAEKEPVWKPLVNNGKGKLPGHEWHSGGHTNSLIPFYAKGNEKALELLRKKASMKDPIRGAFLDNTFIAKTVFELLR